MGEEGWTGRARRNGGGGILDLFGGELSEVFEFVRDGVRMTRGGCGCFQSLQVCKSVRKTGRGYFLREERGVERTVVVDGGGCGGGVGRVGCVKKY